jgi:hypothetical protein
VNYDVFMGMVKGLQALGFICLEKGNVTGAVRRATAFWATDKLVELAEQFGVHLDNVRRHFKPEPPHNPLVIRGPSERRGNKKIRGALSKKYKRNESTRKLEADLKELNAFLAEHEITGGDHEGYTRNFNKADACTALAEATNSYLRQRNAWR